MVYSLFIVSKMFCIKINLINFEIMIFKTINLYLKSTMECNYK